MKKVFSFTASLTLLLGFVFWGSSVFGDSTTLQPAGDKEVPTINCEGGANECARITSGNTVHIFYKG